jgi:acyl carrier protein
MDMENKVLEILKNVLEDNNIDATCTQENCEKWDSMAQLNISVELEDAFDIILEPEHIAEMRSVADICRIISSFKSLFGFS